MAATVVATVPSETSLRFAIVQLTADSSYPTGGYPVPLPAGLPGVSFALATAKGYQVHYDISSAKLLFYRQTAATSALIEVPNTTNLTGIQANILLLFTGDGFVGV